MTARQGELLELGPHDASTGHPTFAAGWWGVRLLIAIVVLWSAGLFVGFRLSLGILTALGFAAAIAGVWRPALGLLGIGMLAALDAPARVLLMSDGLLPWNSFNYLLLLVLLRSAPLLLWIRSAPVLWLFAFVLFAVAGLVISPDVPNGVQDVLGVVSAFGLLIYFVRAARDPDVWYWLALVTGVLAGLGGFVFYLQQQQLPYVNPNAWAFLPLTGLFAICLGFAQASRWPRGQAILMTVAAVNVVWVFLSASRGALFIAAICGMALIVATRGLGRRLVLVSAAMLIAVGVGNHFEALRERTLHRIDKLVDTRYSLAKRTSGRSELVRGGWRMFLDNPIGVGTGGFATTFGQLRLEDDVPLLPRRAPKEAHAAWIKVLAENGVVGLVLLAGFVGSFAVLAWRTRRGEERVLGLLTSLVLGAAFWTTEFQGKGLWFLAAGVIVLLPASRWARAPSGVRVPVQRSSVPIPEGARHG